METILAEYWKILSAAAITGRLYRRSQRVTPRANWMDITQCGGENMRLTWCGHSAFRIEADAAKIPIDPFLSNNPSRDKGWIGGRAGGLDTGRRTMKAIVVTDQAVGTAGLTLVERPEPNAAGNDVVVQVHASGFTSGE